MYFYLCEILIISIIVHLKPNCSKTEENYPEKKCLEIILFV